MASLRTLARQFTPAPVRRLIRATILRDQQPRFRPHTIVKTIGGESFPFYIGDPTAEAWYVPDKDPVNAELVFLRDHMIAPGDLVFDVGSHHGLHAVFLARRPVHVVAIEPNPLNIKCLRQNVELNNLQNVVIRQTAVGNTRGSVSLPLDSGDGGILLDRSKSLPTVDVELLPLDELVSQYGMPSLLKIDVEGFEARVLEGATAILRRRPKIAIEVHTEWVSRYGSSIDEVVKLLNLDAYRVWVFPYNPAIDEVRPWEGEDMNAYPPPKFTLFLLPKGQV